MRQSGPSPTRSLRPACSKARLLSEDITAGLTDPDEVPEPPDEPVTRPGDLWIVGEHRLLCGDSGHAEHVDRLLASATVHLVNTDPPYNVRVEPRSNNAIAAGNSSFTSYHHQQLDPARHPAKSRPTHRKLRANPLSTTDFFYRHCRGGDLRDPAGGAGLLRKVIHIDGRDDTCWTLVDLRGVIAQIV